MIILKFLLLLSVIQCSLAVGPSKHLPDLNEIHYKCQEESNVNETILSEARKGNFKKTNRKLQSHMFCFAKENGFMSETGEFDKEGVKAMMIERLKPTLNKITDYCDYYVQDHTEIEAFATEMLHCLYYYTNEFFKII